MSLRRFDGWEPVTRTRVSEFDDLGRAVAWESRPEPEWDRRERSLMLALAYWEAGCCQRCSEHLSVAMDPDTDPDLVDAERRWVAEGPDACLSCKALTTAERELQKQEGGPELAQYVVYRARLVSRAEPVSLIPHPPPR